MLALELFPVEIDSLKVFKKMGKGSFAFKFKKTVNTRIFLQKSFLFTLFSREVGLIPLDATCACGLRYFCQCFLVKWLLKMQNVGF